jgi:hypothetical protein
MPTARRVWTVEPNTKHQKKGESLPLAMFSLHGTAGEARAKLETRLGRCSVVGKYYCDIIYVMIWKFRFTGC